jgi:hypothetical protein
MHKSGGATRTWPAIYILHNFMEAHGGVIQMMNEVAHVALRIRKGQRDVLLKSANIANS